MFYGDNEPILIAFFYNFLNVAIPESIREAASFHIFMYFHIRSSCPSPFTDYLLIIFHDRQNPIKAGGQFSINDKYIDQPRIQLQVQLNFAKCTAFWVSVIIHYPVLYYFYLLYSTRMHWESRKHAYHVEASTVTQTHKLVCMHAIFLHSWTLSWPYWDSSEKNMYLWHQGNMLYISEHTI